MSRNVEMNLYQVQISPPYRFLWESESLHNVSVKEDSTILHFIYGVVNKKNNES